MRPTSTDTRAASPILAALRLFSASGIRTRPTGPLSSTYLPIPWSLTTPSTYLCDTSLTSHTVSPTCCTSSSLRLLRNSTSTSPARTDATLVVRQLSFILPLARQQPTMLSSYTGSCVGTSSNASGRQS